MKFPTLISNDYSSITLVAVTLTNIVTWIFKTSGSSTLSLLDHTPYNR